VWIAAKLAKTIANPIAHQIIPAYPSIAIPDICLGRRIVDESSSFASTNGQSLLTA
jgi:hypothetical protein